MRVGNPAGVDEDEGVSLCQQRPKILVHRVIELFAASASADGDARETQVVEAASGLVRGVGETERDRPETVQSAGSLGDVTGEFVVAPARWFVVTSLLSSELEQYRNGGIDTAWADTPMSSISASRVRGSYWERARGSGVFLPTPLTDGSSRTTLLDPRQVRQPGALEPFEQRQRHRMVVDVDRCERRRRPRPPVGCRWTRVVGIQFLHVLRVEVHVGRATYARSHAFLLDGTSPSSPYRRLPATCKLRCGVKWSESENVTEEDAMAQTPNFTPDIEAAVNASNRRVIVCSR